MKVTADHVSTFCKEFTLEMQKRAFSTHLAFDFSVIGRFPPDQWTADQAEMCEAIQVALEKLGEV